MRLQGVGSRGGSVRGRLVRGRIRHGGRLPRRSCPVQSGRRTPGDLSTRGAMRSACFSRSSDNRILGVCLQRRGAKKPDPTKLDRGAAAPVISLSLDRIGPHRGKAGNLLTSHRTGFAAAKSSPVFAGHVGIACDSPGAPVKRPRLGISAELRATQAVFAAAKRCHRRRRAALEQGDVPLYRHAAKMQRRRDVARGEACDCLCGG
jgi:hypothetical protein